MVYSPFLTEHAGSSNSTYEHASFNSTARPVIHSEMEVSVTEGSVTYKASEGNSVANSTSIPSQSAYGGMSLPLQVLLSAIMLVIALISFLGNFIVCLMVYQKAAMRSAINILLANLAFADMMLAIMNMPFALITVNTTYWIFGDTFCRVSAMFFWLFVIEGVVILLIISIDRFLIIVQRQDKLNPYRAKVLIAVSWGMAFCMAFPLAVGSPDLPVPSRAPQCVFGYSTDPGYRVYVLLIIIVFFLIPFLLMLYSFMGILNTVRHNAIRIHSNSDGICLGQASKLGLMSLQKPCQLTIDMSFKTRAFTTILILFIIFTLCSAPFTTYSLVSTFNKSFYHKVNFFEISTWFLWLSYLKSALNPLIYYWRIKKFRDACVELLPKTFKFLPQLPGRTRRRVRPSAIYVCGEHRSVV